MKKLSKAKVNYKKRERKMLNRQKRRQEKELDASSVSDTYSIKKPTPTPPSNLVPLETYPEPGDIVYEENSGLVKYRVQQQYDPRDDYHEIILLEVVYDFGNGFFVEGHQSIRRLPELMQEVT